jgi:alkylation response protein AidB-like acyl-CoA dehydrogenase
MDFALTDEQQALQDDAAALGRAVAAEQAILEDSWIIGTSPAFSRELARRHWIGMTWPEAEGGGGRPAIDRFLVYEQLIAAGAPVATTWFADRQIGPTLLAFGTEDQRRRFLPSIIDGTAAWSIGMSEPDAGSDVAHISTRAQRVDPEDDTSDWIVNGAKIWTSGAATADWCYLIARTDPDAPPHAGLSELIVDLHAPGVTISPIEDMTRNRHFCEVVFTDVRVPAENLVGNENDSFRQVMRQMEHERGGIDRLLSNRALFEEHRARADTSDPLVRQELAALESGYRIGRLLVLREVMSQAPKGFSAVTKTFCTEFEQRVATFCAAVAGADALVAGRVARNVCYAPAYTIMGGTTLILRNIIGERMLGLPREPRPAP